MTDTVERQDSELTPPATRESWWRRAGVRGAVALACGLLGFLMVAQVRATEPVSDRLQAERQEDLARILSELTTQSDRLQQEITELRLTLVEFESSAEREELVRRSLERRLDDLRVLTGVVPAEGEGVVLSVEDPGGLVTHDLLVDAIQELRDAGAEAIAVNDVRLVASSGFTTRSGDVRLDGHRLDPPYRIVAIGPADTIASALDIPGGAVDTLQLPGDVRATVETRADLLVPAVSDPPAFVHGVPVEPGTAEDAPGTAPDGES